MAKYHFTKERFVPKLETELPQTRITVEYGKKQYDPHLGVFVSSEHFYDGQRRMKIGNCEGSLMIIDTALDVTSNPINKLHIGDLKIKRPHAESYEEKGEKGVRVDLAEFDTHYAKAMLEDLRNWRNPEYRQAILSKYDEQRKPDGSYKWHCMPFRVKQLGISPQGLEVKIQELEARIDWLRQDPQRDNRRLAYNCSTKIEDKCYNMVVAMGHEVKAASLGKSKGPRIIVNPDICAVAEEINANLVKVFAHIRPQVDVERARRYWEEVASWEHL